MITYRIHCYSKKHFSLSNNQPIWLQHGLAHKSLPSISHTHWGCQGIYIMSMESLCMCDTFPTPKIHCASSKNNHIVITSQAGCHMVWHTANHCHDHLPPKVKVPRHLYNGNAKSQHMWYNFKLIKFIVLQQKKHIVITSQADCNMFWQTNNVMVTS